MKYSFEHNKRMNKIVFQDLNKQMLYNYGINIFLIVIVITFTDNNIIIVIS